MSSFLHWVGEATSPSSFPSSIVNGLLRGRKRRKSERNQNEQFYVVLCLVERGKPEVVAAKKKSDQERTKDDAGVELSKTMKKREMGGEGKEY